MEIELLQAGHLPQLQALVNAHLGAVAPGWALSEAYIAAHLARNPNEYVVDPWVVARRTLCAVERQRVVGVAHLLRYGAGPEVNPSHHGIVDVGWLLFWPAHASASAGLLSAAERQGQIWGAPEVWAWDTGLFVGLFPGLPDVWPHVAAALVAAGYQPDPARGEAAYGGRLDQVPLPGAAPVPGLTLRRTAGSFGTRFAAVRDDEELGYLECVADLTEGGALPALRGWAELADFAVEPAWRNQGIGAWLVQQAVAWLRLGQCDRIVLAVAAENEAAGAGRFYQRCGWNALTRFQQGWRRTLASPTSP